MADAALKKYRIVCRTISSIVLCATVAFCFYCVKESIEHVSSSPWLSVVSAVLGAGAIIRAIYAGNETARLQARNRALEQQLLNGEPEGES